MPALQEGRRSTCRRLGVHLKVCRATSRRLCFCHCTDRLVLARAAGSSKVPTGIDRSIDPEQLGALAVRSECRRAAIGGVVWPARSRVDTETAHETALLVLGMYLYGHAVPCCVVCMHPLDTVGSTAEKERSERSTHAVSWTYRGITLDGSRPRRFTARLFEIDGD